MDFIINNWVWFAIGGIVILMTIIGYIAEKTDFGRKSFAETNNKKENKNEKVEKIEEIIKEPDVQMALATDAVLTEEEPEVKNEIEFEMPAFEVPAPIEEIITTDEDLTVPFGEVENNVVEEPLEQFSETNIFEVNDQEFEMPSLSRENQNNEYFNVDESVENGIHNIVEEEPTYMEESQDVADTEIELPDLESLLNNNNIKVAVEEDDVWKF